MKKLFQTITLLILSAGLSMCTSPTNGNNESRQSAKETTDSITKVPLTNAEIIVLLAHPNISKSHMNATLTQAAESVHGVQVVNIYNYPVTPDAYRDVIAHAKGIVYEFPCYWMSAPHLLKQWTDEVFTVFTQEGLIKGKEFMVAVTTGSEKEAYQHGGRNLYTIEEYMRPYEGQANHAGMIWNKPFVVYGNPKDKQKAEADLQAGAEAYKKILAELVRKVSTSQQ